MSLIFFHDCISALVYKNITYHTITSIYNPYIFYSQINGHVFDLTTSPNKTTKASGRNLLACEGACLNSQCQNGALCSSPPITSTLLLNNTDVMNKTIVFPYTCRCGLGWRGTTCAEGKKLLSFWM